MARLIQGLCLLTTVSAVLVFASASPAAAATDLDVTTPADGRYQPGTTTPFIITISADGAVEGTLRISFDGQNAASQRVDVPGGSEKQIVMMAATLPWSSGIQVAFDAEGGSDDASVRANLTRPNGDEIVGVFPELAGRELPATADLAVDLGQARLYPVALDLLDHGPDVLSPFSQIIATPGDLERLTDTQRESLEGWVGSFGGELLIDGDETDVALSIEANNRGSFSLGLGTVRFTGTSAAITGFDALFAPTMPRGSQDFPWGDFFGGVPTSINLARDAGVRVPAIGAITIGLLVYTLVVGPILWFLLKRTKREPGMWLAVPGLAVVTALGVWVVGLQLREGANTAHATVIADLPNSRQMLSQVLVTSANGGLEGISLPVGWRSVTSNEDMFMGPGMISAAPIERDGKLLTDLDPGGLGVVGAETNQPAEAPSFALDLRADGDSLVGTVTNLTPYDVSEGLIASGQGVASFGALGAGETKDVSVTGFDRSPFNGDPLMERIMRNDPWSPNDGPSNPGVLINWLSRRPTIRSAEFAIALGWTREAESPLQTDGGAAVAAGRTAFVTVVPLASNEVSSLTNRVTYLRGYETSRITDTPVGGVCTDFPLTYAIKPAVVDSGEPLVLAVNRRAVAAFDVWDGDAWVPGQMAEIEVDDPVIGIPVGAFEAGSLYVRVQLTCEVWNIKAPLPALRVAAADDSVIPFGSTTSEEADPDA